MSKQEWKAELRRLRIRLDGDFKVLYLGNATDICEVLTDNTVSFVIYPSFPFTPYTNNTFDSYLYSYIFVSLRVVKVL